MTSVGHRLSVTTASGVMDTPPISIFWFKAATVPSGAGGTTAGQAANSHFGPVRPTDEPSGQTLASSVQAVVGVVEAVGTTATGGTAVVG